MSSILLTAPQETLLKLGGWDLAICSALFLQGVLYAQFTRFLKKRDSNSIWLKFFVAGLTLMTTLKGLQALALMWIQNVLLFGNSLSRNAYIVIACITLFTLGLVAAIVTTVFIFENSPSLGFTGWKTTHLGIVFCGDLFLTGSMVFWLLRHSETVLSRGPTATILKSLLRVTIQAPPAAICTFIAFVVTIQCKAWTPVSVLINCIVTMVLPQLYAWSAMWALNWRHEICVRAAETYTINLGTALACSDPEVGVSSRSPTAEEGGTG
ncbi:hypothetical protein K438DRAFT_1954280 [Mycena galopus ATCC 62051]|nr:hypothetical protein K438DRAFT_1954280 [Mycena galopus ATCC 62051]